MAQSEKTCPKCKQPMQEGFLLDSYNAFREGRQGVWVEGRPERRFFGQVKLRGRKVLPVTVCRCAGCGYLESYASPG